MSDIEVSHDSETPAAGQQVFTVCAFIHQMFDGVEKVFLPKRAMTKKLFPGVYELPGGHVDYGENLIVALKREIEEEFGMNIAVGDPFYVFDYANPIKGSHSIEVVYFAHFTTDIAKIEIHTDDHSEYGWFAENELDKVTSANKSIEDIEFQGLLKGFALLKGEHLRF